MTWVYPLDAAHPGTLDDVKALVGGKAANLGVMARDLRLPVPPGFVVTTEACRTYLASGWPAGLDEELRASMTALEAAVGRRFGDPANPLLVSVRSGAPVSMPGMMDTILDLGLNDETTAGLARATGDEAFAQSCRQRLVAGFGSIVGEAVPDDHWRQLRLAIEAVFRSWTGERARAYRQKEGISDDLGTAATIQAMVFGNRGATSGTGVVFTRNPATGERAIYGDVLFDAQGEDVVAGTHQTEPIAVLDERLPLVSADLRSYAERLERSYMDLCDIEFTIDDGRLWMLQVRVGKRSPQAALRIAVDMAEDPGFPLTRVEAVRRVLPLLVDPPTVATIRRDDIVPLLTGLGASPGAASGPIVLSPEAAVDAADHARPAILVRAETSPDDVHGMARAAGILTATGGLASHAAVVARGWGIPAVVGAEAMAVRADEVVIGGRPFRPGDVLTIDGTTGEVFEGAVAGSAEVAPEARTLRSWADELGIAVGNPEAPAQVPAPDTGVGRGRASPELCLRAISIKGFAPLAGLAEALLTTPEMVQPIVDQLALEGLVGTAAGAYRLTDSGVRQAASSLEAERTTWGAAAAAALEAFVDLDHRTKDIVTDWQVRDPVGQVINDHSDAVYDRAVLDRLAVLHADADAWLAEQVTGCPRLAGYRDRLSRALDRALAGDPKYVASPRVDSYHGAWFELHEDLIQLAGRSRADEVAAGRA